MQKTVKSRNHGLVVFILLPSGAEVVAPDKTLSMGQIELNCVPMITYIVLNRTVYDIETAY